MRSNKSIREGKITLQTISFALELGLCLVGMCVFHGVRVHWLPIPSFLMVAFGSLILGAILKYISERYHIDIPHWLVSVFGYLSIGLGVAFVIWAFKYGDLEPVTLKRLVLISYFSYIWFAVIYIYNRKKRRNVAWEKIDSKDDGGIDGQIRFSRETQDS